MHQHQHAPLPLDLLEAVPQPVVVLLDVLFEKDPVGRFQNPIVIGPPKLPLLKFAFGLRNLTSMRELPGSK
jgi:hypothetical protein